MTLDEKITLASLMVEISLANMEQAGAVLEIVVAAKDHVSNEMVDRVLAANEKVKQQYDALKLLMHDDVSSAGH
jgi:chromosomal replication initiation ATPase DnaA